MSLMNVGVTALNTNQAALQTVSNNIANVNTTGYSRQTTSLKTNHSTNTGSGYIGNGVSVASITRNYSELLNRQSNAASAASAADIARNSALTQMQSVFTGGASSLGAAITGMLNSFTDVEAAPSDGTARNVALTRMTELASRFRASSDAMDEQDYLVKQQISNGVTQINSLASQVATLNGQISRAMAVGQAPNDLLDARDQAIRQINKLVQTSQVESGEGVISLFVGGSHPLVLGSTTGKLSVSETAEYPGSGKLSLYFSHPSGPKVEMSPAMVAGGELAGLLKFNNDDLVTGRNLLGRLALSVGTLMNEQNALGLTLGGVPGSELFKLQASEGYTDITGYRSLPSDERAKVTVADGSNLIASDYKVIYGANHPTNTKLVRLSDGFTRNVDDIWDASTSSFIADGLKFTLPDTAVSTGYLPREKDSILFQPYSSIAGTIQSAVHNPNDLAVSNAISASIPSNNQGILQLSLLKTTDMDAIPATQTPLQLKFLTGGKVELFQLDSAGTPSSLGLLTEPDPDNPGAVRDVMFTSGMTIKLVTDNASYGIEIKLTGTPGMDGNDTVTISNALDLGDGYKLNAGNASAFLALRDGQIFDDGTTLSDGFSSAMAVIGTRAQSAKYAADLSSTIAANLEADRTSVSGVNLDEEAARLLQYQQAYQASAKIITVAQSLFDSVLSAMR